MAIRQLNIEGRTYYFYIDLRNIKNFNNNNLKLNKKSVLVNDVYYIGYIPKKPQWNVNSVNPLYLMIKRIKGHLEEVDGDKYLIISSENDDIMQKYQEVFDRIKEIIKKINDYSQPIKHDENYYNHNHQKFHKKDDKYYPQLVYMKYKNAGI